MFKYDGTKSICTECGAEIHPRHVRHHKCTNPDGLGDRIERWLTSHGITKERYTEIKKEFGLPPTCHCDGRKEWFNKVGKFLGISADTYGKKTNGS